MDWLNAVFHRQQNVSVGDLSQRTLIATGREFEPRPGACRNFRKKVHAFSIFDLFCRFVTEVDRTFYHFYVNGY